MISAETVRLLGNLSVSSIGAFALQNKIKNAEKFVESDFLGITNGGEFCYSVKCEDGNTTVTKKVFLSQDPVTYKILIS